MEYRGTKTVAGLTGVKESDLGNFNSDLNRKLTEITRIFADTLVYFPRNIEVGGDFSIENGLLTQGDDLKEIDLSAIITFPKPKLVKLRIEVAASAAGESFNIYPWDAPTGPNRQYLVTQAASVLNSTVVDIPITYEKKLMYTISAGTYTTCQINVLGWWG